MRMSCRILSTVNDAEALNKLRVDQFTNLFVKA